MVQCKAIKENGVRCKNNAVTGSDFCVFHGGKKGKKVGFSTDLAQAEIVRKEGMSFFEIFGRNKITSETPRTDKLKEYEKYYDNGGLVSTAIDSMVSVAIGNGYQFIDNLSGKTETYHTRIIKELDERVNLHNVFEKAIRSSLISGFCWAEMVVENTNIIKINFLPPYEIDIDRDKNTGQIETIRQIKGTETIATWKKVSNDKSDKNIKNIFYFSNGCIHSELYGKSQIGKIYEESKDRDTTRENMTAVSEFVAYPFRVVKVGNNEYPASKKGVTDVADQVEKLEPGDWLVTRHNVEFQFEAPKAPPALQDTFEQQTRSLVVSLGVPSLYTSFKDIDAQTLKEIRSIFNSTIRTIQKNLAFAVQDQIFKRQFELKNVAVARHPHPVLLSWNPLSVSVLSILELTQLINVGAVSISEARRILESMGYGLLRGDVFSEEQAEKRGELKNPKQTHPTEDEPDKLPNKSIIPRKEEEPPIQKKPSDSPIIKKPQPNAPKLSYEEWIEAIKILKEIDKKEAYNMLMKELKSGFYKEKSKEIIEI